MNASISIAASAHANSVGGASLAAESDGNCNNGGLDSARFTSGASNNIDPERNHNHQPSVIFGSGNSGSSVFPASAGFSGGSSNGDTTKAATDASNLTATTDGWGWGLGSDTASSSPLGSTGASTSLDWPATIFDVSSFCNNANAGSGFAFGSSFALSGNTHGSTTGAASASSSTPAVPDYASLPALVPIQRVAPRDPASWSSLLLSPTEWSQVFTLLDISDFARVSRVCRGFYEAASLPSAWSDSRSSGSSCSRFVRNKKHDHNHGHGEGMLDAVRIYGRILKIKGNEPRFSDLTLAHSPLWRNVRAIQIVADMHDAYSYRFESPDKLVPKGCILGAGIARLERVEYFECSMPIHPAPANEDGGSWRNRRNQEPVPAKYIDHYVAMVRALAPRLRYAILKEPQKGLIALMAQLQYLHVDVAGGHPNAGPEAREFSHLNKLHTLILCGSLDYPTPASIPIVHYHDKPQSAWLKDMGKVLSALCSTDGSLRHLEVKKVFAHPSPEDANIFLQALVHGSISDQQQQQQSQRKAQLENAGSTSTNHLESFLIECLPGQILGTTATSGTGGGGGGAGADGGAIFAQRTFPWSLIYSLPKLKHCEMRVYVWPHEVKLPKEVFQTQWDHGSQEASASAHQLSSNVEHVIVDAFFGLPDFNRLKTLKKVEVTDGFHACFSGQRGMRIPPNMHLPSGVMSSWSHSLTKLEELSLNLVEYPAAEMLAFEHFPRLHTLRLTSDHHHSTTQVPLRVLAQLLTRCATLRTVHLRCLPKLPLIQQTWMDGILNSVDAEIRTQQAGPDHDHDRPEASLDSMHAPGSIRNLGAISVPIMPERGPPPVTAAASCGEVLDYPDVLSLLAACPHLTHLSWGSSNDVLQSALLYTHAHTRTRLPEDASTADESGWPVWSPLDDEPLIDQFLGRKANHSHSHRISVQLARERHALRRLMAMSLRSKQQSQQHEADAPQTKVYISTPNPHPHLRVTLLEPQDRLGLPHELSIGGELMKEYGLVESEDAVAGTESICSRADVPSHLQYLQSTYPTELLPTSRFAVHARHPCGPPVHVNPRAPPPVPPQHPEVVAALDALTLQQEWKEEFDATILQMKKQQDTQSYLSSSSLSSSSPRQQAKKRQKKSTTRREQR